MTDRTPPTAPKVGEDHALVSKSSPHDEKPPSKGHSEAVKPEKPDEDAYKVSLERARSNLADAQELNKKAQVQLNEACPGRAKDPPSSQRLVELRAELALIRSQQQDSKTSRGKIQDRMKAVDTQLRTRLAEQKEARSRISFKSVEEIDREIKRLEAQVDGGKMKIVDEKKALAEVTSLLKQRKQLVGIEGSNTDIDALKATLSDIKKELHDPAVAEMSDHYDKITKQIDDIKAVQAEKYANLGELRDNAAKARANQDQKYTELKSIQDAYHAQRRSYLDYEKEAGRRREAARKLEREQYLQEKQRRILEEKLEEASVPAYFEEIRAADILIRLLDPSYTPSSTAAGPGEFAAVAQRTVDDSGLKGTRIIKKDHDEESYFTGSQNKRGKKGEKSRKVGPTAQASSKSTSRDLGVFMNERVLEQFTTVGIAPPSTQEEIPTTLEKMKSKRDLWTKDRQRKTEENIAAAKQEIDRFDSGANNTPGSSVQSSTDARKPADDNKVANGTHPVSDNKSSHTGSESPAKVTNGLPDNSVADDTKSETTVERESLP